MRWALAAALVASLLVAGTGGGGGTAGAEAQGRAGAPPIGDGRGGIRLREVADFDEPVYVHGPQGAGDLVFVVEQDGRIGILRGDRKLAGSFLDIRGRVNSGGEQGLLSVAFPDWRDSRRFYVYYTDAQGDLRIVEFKRQRDRPLRADEGSARNVLQIGHSQYENHNGGQLQFGPDGKLWIGTGDGGGGGDPFENAQDKGSLLGKLLRIDPRRRGGRAYTSPRGNPYVGGPGQNEIYARGLRNPWRFSFDRRRVVIGDVGESECEEVDYETLDGARGANFGWDAFECTEPHEGGGLSRHDRPIHHYSHSGGRCTIIGGYVVRDRRLDSLFGRYVYADLCEGQIRSLVPRIGGARDDEATGLPRVDSPSSFGEDARGRVYVASLGGTVYRISPR